MSSMPPYPTRHYAVGEFLLTLRNRAKLTQAALAAQLGLHRRSVQKWESGESYPTADNLHALIELFVGRSVFIPEQERDEAVALWQLVSQHAPQHLPPFDTAWFDQLLAVRTVGAQRKQQLHTSTPIQTSGNPSLVDQSTAEESPAFGAQPQRLGLPAQAAPLIGRAGELDELAKLLADPACRLLTLLGPGGIGKTRLALAIAQARATTFRDGVAFVPLISVTTPSQIVVAIGDVLHLSFEDQANPTTHLLTYLRTRRMLLLLDDFEHLVEGADLIATLLQAAPQLTILVTSRVRLNLQAEWLYSVDGLAYPPSDVNDSVPPSSRSQLTDYSAIQLFVQRATQLLPTLTLTDATLLAIARICRHVAGMPLAIELAAASIRTLPIAEIERQISSNLDLLATTLRDVPPRHRSLRAVFDHSWNLLNEVERVVLSRLAIFRGGWDQEAAAAICKQLTGQSQSEPGEQGELPLASYTFSPALLAALLDKSLVQRIRVGAQGTEERQVNSGPVEPRYLVLEPLREYALEKLAARGEAALLRRAHAIHYLTVAEAAAAQWLSPTADVAIARLDDERDNLRAALQWTCDGGDVLIGLRLGGALIRFWRRRGARSEGRAWLEKLLALESDPADGSAKATQLRVMQGAAWLASDQHDYERATQLFEQSVVLRRALGEHEDETNLLVNEALRARMIGRYPQASALLEEVITRQRALGNRGSFGGIGIGMTLFLFALVQREQGNFAAATALYEECVALHRALGDREGIAVGLLGLSDIARDQGNVALLQNYGRESLTMLRKLGVQWASGFALNNLALAAFRQGDLTEAFALIDECVAIFRAQNAEGSLAEVLITLGQIVWARQDVAAAYAALTEAARLAWDVGPRLLAVSALEALAHLAMQPKSAPRDAILAARFLAVAATARTQMGAPLRPVDQPMLDHTLAAIRTSLNPDTFAAVWAEAAVTPLEAILAAIPGVESFAATSAADPILLGTAPVAQSQPRVDWGLAREVAMLYGRAEELATLNQWVHTDRCRVITLVGMGGIGKTSLAITFARQVVSHFAVMIFCSLGEAPAFDDLVDRLIHKMDPAQTSAPSHRSNKIDRLIDLLRQERVLLILDNLETLLQAGVADTPYLAGYADYGTLFKTIGETAHQSCLILTSRERPHELAALEGPHTPVRSLRLTGLSEAACRALLADQDLAGTAEDAAALAQRYGGNPLALKLVFEPIRVLFGGDLAAFLAEGNLFFNGVGQLLGQQISRASVLEQDLLIWLALARAPLSVDQLASQLVDSAPRAMPRTAMLATLHALWRRNLLELGQAHLTFALQPVVLEYLTEYLVNQVVGELLAGTFDYLHRFALIHATAKEYIRRSQERLIGMPLLEGLRAALGSVDQTEQRLLTLLDVWRESMALPLPRAQSYAVGNVLNLLHLLRGHLRGLNLARLAIRQAYLQGVELQDTSLAEATVRETVFSETFDAMTAVTISRTGKYWATVSRRGRVRVWLANGSALDSPIPGSLHHLWRAHNALVWSITFSPDERLLASASWDNTVKLWDVATGTLRWEGQHTNQVSRVAFAPNGRVLASAAGDATVRLWDVAQGTLLQTLSHPESVAAVAWTPDGQFLVSSDLTGAIRLWDVRQVSQRVTCIQTLKEHSTWVDGLAFAPDGRTLASASYDGTVKLWEFVSAPSQPANDADVTTLGDGLPLLRLREIVTSHMAWVHRVAWSPDGRILASCSFAQTIWLWDNATHTFRAPLQGHTAVVYDLAFTPDSRSLLSCSEDGALRVWEVATSQCSQLMAGYTGAIYDVDWSPDGAQLVSVGTDALVTIYPVINEEPVTNKERVPAAPKRLRGHTNSVFGVSWSPHGRWLASSELDNVILLWDSVAGNSIQTLHHPDDTANLFYGLAWSPEGERLAAGTATHGLLLWDLKANRLQWAGPSLSTKIRHVAWHPAGAQLACGGDDGTIYLLDATDGKLSQRLTGHRSMITSLVWSPSGTYLATSSSGNEEGELFVWDLQQATPSGTRMPHPTRASAVAWGVAETTGEQWLISGSSDGTLRWWNLKNGECVRTVEGHQGMVPSLRRSPDGRRLASCGDDGTIMLWDLQSGDHLRTLCHDRPYERLNITGIRGLTAAQITTLCALGAITEDVV